MDITILEGAANIIEAASDQSKFFQIKLNGKAVSFGRVRLWKTKGAAISAIGKNMSYWLKGYRNEVPGLCDILTKYNNGDRVAPGSNSYPIAKELIEGLIEKEILKIEEI